MISPTPFNLYMDELRLLLNKNETGCNVNSQFINHLMYADDCVLIAPFPKSLQQMLNLCESYA